MNVPITRDSFTSNPLVVALENKQQKYRSLSHACWILLTTYLGMGDTEKTAKYSELLYNYVKTDHPNIAEWVEKELKVKWQAM